MSSDILMYIRPYSKDIFMKATVLAFNTPQIQTISEYPKTADYWIGDYVYSDKYDSPLNPEDVLNDIIERDRALRGMERSRTVRIANRFLNGCMELLASNEFEYLVTMTIDCYCVDVLVRAAESFGLKIISPMATFLKDDYARFTLRGERIDLLREVSDEEVRAIHDRLVQKTFLPKTETKNVERTPKDIYAFYWRRIFIEALYHPIRRLVDHDPDNPRWNTSLALGAKLNDYYSHDYDDYFTPIEQIDFSGGNVAYLPLHLIPEATTNYFCKGIAHEGYENYVLRVAKEKAEGVHLVIKEHPAMYGKRLLDFYLKLNEIPDVTVVHPLQRSNELIERVNLVVVDNGTVGVEALMRGKKVLALESNYYSDLHPNITVRSSITRDDMTREIVSYDNHEFVRGLLGGMFFSDFYDNGAGMKAIDAEKLAEGFKLYLRML